MGTARPVGSAHAGGVAGGGVIHESRACVAGQGSRAPVEKRCVCEVKTVVSRLHF